MWQKIDGNENRLIYSNGSEESVLELIYNHSELGKYYMFSPTSSIPYQRKYVLDLIIQNESLGVGKSEILEILEQSMLSTQKGDTYNSYALQATLKARIKDEWSHYHSNMLIAAAFIVGENENIGTFNQTLGQEKIKLWSADVEMTAFFLSKAQGLTMNLINGLSNLLKGALGEEKPQIQDVPTLADALSK